ncbi:MAG: site-specific integrase [Nocardioidaceae bacterium]|nr:site-specific integrase [Nocardioidaceae bacterium]
MKRGSRWSYVIRVVDPATGRSRPKWVGGFSSEAAAKAARDDARVTARRGEYVDKDGVTVRGYLLEWLETHAGSVKPKTLAGYRYNLEHWVIPHIGGQRLQGLRPAAISKLYRDLAASGGRGGRPLSARSVEAIHRTLRKALNDAVHVERLITSNPAERAKRPRAARREVVRVWNVEQLGTFLATAQTHRLYAFYRLAAYTGARRGELLYLRWSDLAMDECEVTITGSAAVVEGQRIEGTTKGDRSRVVSVDAGTVAILREHRARQVAERLKAGSLWTDTGGHVFVTETGKPLSPDTASQLMPKLVSTAGVPHARLHDLRHLHATTLLLAGVPVHVVAARLGHADASVTLRVYAHVLRQDTVDIGNVFATAVSAC